MRLYLIAVAALPLALLCAPALAQEAGTAPSAVAETPPPAACCTAPVGTVVQIEVVPLLSTRTMKRGDRFEIRLAEPLVIDGAVLLPAGLTGGGEVVHAAGPSIGGKPGEVILAARYLDYDGRRIPLKAMKLGRAGQDNGAASLAVSMVTPIGMFIPGGHVEIVAGSRANAKLAADIILSPVAPSTPIEAPTAGSVDSPPAETTNQDPPQ
jgi:hypothetical protein